MDKFEELTEKAWKHFAPPEIIYITTVTTCPVLIVESVLTSLHVHPAIKLDDYRAPDPPNPHQQDREEMLGQLVDMFNLNYDILVDIFADHVDPYLHQDNRNEQFAKCIEIIQEMCSEPTSMTDIPLTPPQRERKNKWRPRFQIRQTRQSRYHRHIADENRV